LPSPVRLERRSYPLDSGKIQFRRGAHLIMRSSCGKTEVRRIYGILERQFRRYFRDALRRPGLTGATC
jgi:hypothetical protein